MTDFVSHISQSLQSYKKLQEMMQFLTVQIKYVEKIGVPTFRRFVTQSSTTHEKRTRVGKVKH